LNIVSPSWDNLADVLDGDIEWAFISSPWFSAEGVKKLGTLLPDKKLRNIVSIEIWFRMNVNDHLLGITDYESVLCFVERIQRQLKGDRLQLFVSNSLHAKVYASDKRILLTSANLTKSGFLDNLEIGIITNLSDSLKSELMSFIKEQRRYLELISISKLRNFVRQLNSKVIENYRREIKKILNSAQNQMSLSSPEERFPPHMRFPIR